MPVAAEGEEEEEEEGVTPASTVLRGAEVDHAPGNAVHADRAVYPASTEAAELPVLVGARAHSPTLLSFRAYWTHLFSMPKRLRPQTRANIGLTQLGIHRYTECRYRTSNLEHIHQLYLKRIYFPSLFASNSRATL